jgi:hypothetical protein
MLNALAGMGPGPKAGGRATGGLARPEKRRVPLWMMTGFWVSITISVAVVLRRLVAMARPSHLGPQQMLALDRAFASRSALTLAHIVPALLFVLLLPFLFIRRASATFAERLLFPLGAVVGITAYLMSADAIGGWVERSAVLLFNSLYLFSLARAYGYMRRGNYVQQRRWMVRSVAVLLGIATTRPVMGVFFATRGLTHLEPRQFFGIAFWIGFSINTIAVELWLHSRQRPSQTATMATNSAT